MTKQILTFIVSIAVCVSAEGQNVPFNDSSFKRAILNHVPVIDLNHDNNIQIEEAEKVEVLNLMGKGITEIADISYFRNLKKLFLTDNTIDTLFINGFQQLEALYCAKASLKKAILNNLPKLTDLALGRNSLREVELAELPNLTSLNLMDNNLTALNVSPFRKLRYLTVDHNKINSLDISTNHELLQLIVNNNQLRMLDITKNPKLKVDILYIDDNVKLIGTDEQLRIKTAKPVITRQ